jgi:hypothetical protein
MAMMETTDWSSTEEKAGSQDLSTVSGFTTFLL